MDALTTANLVAWALQAAAVILVAAPLPRLLGIWSPRARLVLWRVVLAVCLVLPLLQAWTSPPAAPVPTDQASYSATASTDPSPAPADAAAATRWWVPFTLQEVIVAGIVLRTLWLAVGLLAMARLRRAAHALDPRPEAVQRAVALAGADAEFLVAMTANKPVTWGVVRPVVLLPPEFPTFSADGQTAITLHELLHVRRRDWLRTGFDELLRAVCWFHPGIWWLVDQLELAREQVVDREAVRCLGAKQPYLQTLLQMATAPRCSALAPASLFLKRAHLRQRVTLLVKEVSMSKARLVLATGVMMACVFVGGRLAVGAFPLQAPAPVPAVTAIGPKLATTARVTLKLPNATVQQALDTVAKSCSIEILPHPGLERLLAAHIDVVLDNATAEQALTSIAKSAAGLSYRVVGPRSVEILRSRTLRASTPPAPPAPPAAAQAPAPPAPPTAARTPQPPAPKAPPAPPNPPAPPQTPPPPPAQYERSMDWPADAIKVGGGITPPTKTRDVKPIYPDEAHQAQVQGVVILEVLIGTDGEVADARILRSVPMLDQAAFDAVCQWQFTPTLLNGVAVPVIMTVTVNFTLE
ncbi:MAG TPA: M56 family metallopeptidase [Vicinamibacterales bacterium]|jgi:protein TonB